MSLWQKMNSFPKHRCAGPPEARGPMQLHQLHRPKAGPDNKNMTYGSSS